MKKALTKVMLTAITLVILAAIVPLSASASTSNESEIFKQLISKLDINPAAACGIMANMEHESNFNPTTVITDSNGLPSGGLCQWNGSRFTNLKNFCSNNGYNYLSIDGQIAFLRHELNNGYNSIYSYLKNVPNNSQGAYDAAWYWCYYFEIPADRGYKADYRGRNASYSYWPAYGQVDVKEPTLSLQNQKKPYDLDNSITFKWTKGGNDVTNYELYVVKKSSKGKCDWSKASVYNLGSGVTSKTIKAKTLKTGNYAAYVAACDSVTNTVKKSNTVNFTVKCLTHNYKSKVVKASTFTEKGKKLLTCKQCGAEKTQSIAKLTYDDFKKIKLQNLKVKSYSDTRIKLSWTPVAGADGYNVYRKINNSKWKRIASVKNPKASELLLTKLNNGKKYRLTVRAFKLEKDGDQVLTKLHSAITASTRPSATSLSKLSPFRKSCKLSWDKVEGVDGYTIYAAKGRNSTDFKPVATIDGNDNVSYTVKNLVPGQVTYFKIKTFNKVSGGYALSKSSETERIIGI